jgi:hypothetical protein
MLTTIWDAAFEASCEHVGDYFLGKVFASPIRCDIYAKIWVTVPLLESRDAGVLAALLPCADAVHVSVGHLITPGSVIIRATG